MPSYPGKYVQQIDTRNFGGINRNATLVNIGQNQARDITNWDIGLDGAITRRKGFTTVATIDGGPTLAIFYYPFQDTDGTFRHCVVAYENATTISLYDAPAASGPYTLRGSGLFTETDPSKYIGVSWRSALYIFNGTDKPIYHTYQGTAKTLEAASQIANNTGIIITTTGVPYSIAAFHGYGVAAYTPRGRVIATSAGPKDGVGNHLGNGTAANFVAGSRYVTIDWDPVVDAYGYEIYIYYITGESRYSVSVGPAPASGSWVRMAIVTADSLSFVDTGFTIDVGATSVVYAPSTNTTANTPTDWNNNGQPQGGIVISKGQDERMMVWRKNTVWASALINGKDWFESGDAFTFPVSGGVNTNIKGAASLFEYTVFFSATDAYIYTGASISTMQMQKIIPVGCVAHNSIVRVGTDLALWSQYGPTTFQRILSGADIAASSGFNDNIKPIIFEETNLSAWGHIHGHFDIPKNRIVWAVPGTEQTKNNMAIVYQYDTKSFTKYDNWHFIHSYVTPGTTDIYSVFDASTGGIAKLNTTNLDDGATITATYSSGYFDWGTWVMKKRMIWCDVLASTYDGAYSFNFSWNWDYGQIAGTPIPCTESTTDGSTIETTSSEVSVHRCYTNGIGNAVQLVFTSTGGDQSIKILGWRPEVRSKGIR